MSADAIARVRAMEAEAALLPQVDIHTRNLLHAGLYARTIRLPAGAALTGALIKIATVVIVSGHVSIYVDGEVIELAGYHVLPASAGRKQAFLAHADTDITMLFPSRAATVEAAEAEFTDEADRLLSRSHGSTSLITGE